MTPQEIFNAISGGVIGGLIVAPIAYYASKRGASYLFKDVIKEMQFTQELFDKIRLARLFLLSGPRTIDAREGVDYIVLEEVRPGRFLSEGPDVR